MALPATSSPPSQWQFEHTQPSHRNSPHGQKRSLSERDDNKLQTPINSFKRLRINHAPLPQRFGRVSYRSPTSEDHLEIDASHGGQHEDYNHASHTSNVFPGQQAFHTSMPQQEYQSSNPSYNASHPNSHEDHSMHIDSTHSTKPHHQSHLSPLHDRQYTSTPPPARTQSDLSDFMSLDSSSHPHKVIISDLDAELAEIEAEEAAARAREQESNFFLPEDVQKEINGIPEHVLRTMHGQPSTAHYQKEPSSALVLYRPPPVLNVPDEMGEEKGLRKSILEERRKQREERRERDEQLQQQNQSLHMHDGRPGHEIEIGREAEGYTNRYGNEFANRIKKAGVPEQIDIPPSKDGQEMEWEPDAMDIE